jgi:hypothetical protein
MATSFVYPSRKWVSISMSFSGGKTHYNSPLPSYQSPKWKNILSLWYEMTLLQNLHSNLFDLSSNIKYHGLDMFHLLSIEKTKK